MAAHVETDTCRFCGRRISTNHIGTWMSVEDGISCPTKTGEIYGHLPLKHTNRKG